MQISNFKTDPVNQSCDISNKLPVQDIVDEGANNCAFEHVSQENVELKSAESQLPNSSINSDSDSEFKTNNSSCRSPFSMTETDSILVVNDKKPKVLAKRQNFDDPFMSDPLYFKFKEFQLLSSRLDKLKKFFLKTFRTRIDLCTF